MSVTEHSRSPRSLKRDHDSFEDLADLEQPFSVPPFFDTQPSQRCGSPERESRQEPSQESLPTPPVSTATSKRDPSPARSSTGSLTDAGSATPSYRGGSPMPGSGFALASSAGMASPSAFAALNGNVQPPPKKVKLTFQEKEMKRINKEIKDQERAAEKARKEEERQAHAEEKAKKEAEKEVERRKKEAEKEAKRKVQEAEKAEKEEKKRKKEEEKQRAEEEKRKKERSQMKLGNFFNIPTPTKQRASSVDGNDRSMSPAPNPSLLGTSAASPAPATPSKPETSTYDKKFPPFFVQNNVTLAPINRFERDEEASESIQQTVDSYIHGNRSPGRQRPFDAVSLFHLCGQDHILRGKRCMSVREIMAEVNGSSSRPIDLTTDSQNSQIKRTGEMLQKVPMKFLKFQEDVRPPYRGTYTSRPISGMTKLARNPLKRDLPDTDYDYDSEAEWIEDEDAEDLNSEGEEDDEGVEDGEDMEGFLDDEGDETANSKRLVLQGDLEPVSTGLCWEDRKKRNTNVKMLPYRMEIIISKFPFVCSSTLTNMEMLDSSLKSIDPFSTSYWDRPPGTSTTNSTPMDPPRLPLNAMKSTSSNVNGPNTNTTKPIKPFFTPASDLVKSTIPQQQLSQFPAHPSSSTAASSKPAKEKKLLPAEDLDNFKREVDGSNLSKVGLIEVLKKKFPGRKAPIIKNTLEAVAKRVGSKEADKRWMLLDSRV